MDNERELEEDTIEEIDLNNESETDLEIDSETDIEIDYNKYYEDNVKPKKKVPFPLIIIGVLILTGLLVLAAVVVERNTPSKEYVNLHNYYEINNEQLIIVYDGGILETTFYEQGVPYLSYDFVRTEFTDRFYYDESLDCVLYTTATEIYEISFESKEYSIDGEKFYEEYDIAVKEDGEIYIAVDFLTDKATFAYELLDNPNRLVIITEGMVIDELQFSKGARIRTDDSIKSPIIGDAFGENNWFATENAASKGWVAVSNMDGRTGYVKATDITGTMKDKVFQSDFEIPEYTTCKKDYDIVLVWHAIYNTNANANIADLLSGTKGVNTVSPTWYKVADETGALTSIADKEYVEYIHGLGMEIWPLISDFTSVENDGWDIEELLSNAVNRRKLIDNIIAEVKEFGYDGINIDFEHITTEAAAGYTQFVRELSIQCREQQIVLSIDNYVPMSHNLHYNRTAQGECADYVIVMGYDEHYRGGGEAGSVASIGFVENGILNTLEEVPSDKLINALPFYTRLWEESENEDGEIVLNSTSYSMDKAVEKIDELGLDMEWDSEVEQYVAKGEVDGVYYSIWLEEEESLAAKMKVVRDNKLAGIAAWSLGMEKESVWDIITE